MGHGSKEHRERERRRKKKIANEEKKKERHAIDREKTPQDGSRERRTRIRGKDGSRVDRSEVVSVVRVSEEDLLGAARGWHISFCMSLIGPMGGLVVRAVQIPDLQKNSRKRIQHHTMDLTVIIS